MPAQVIKQIVFDVMQLEDKFKGPEELGIELKLVEDLGADSLDLVETVMEIERVFDIDIDDTHFENIKTIGDAVLLVDYLLEKKL